MTPSDRLQERALDPVLAALLEPLGVERLVLAAVERHVARRKDGAALTAQVTKTRDASRGRLAVRVLNHRESVAAGDDETRVQLARGVPVHILYWTVIPDDTTGVRFVDDLYDRDQNLIAALGLAPPPLESRD